MDNSIQTLPLDIVSLLLRTVLAASGFADFYSMLKAWAQAQKKHLILRLLEDFPISGLYRFGNVGSMSDKAAFQQFMIVAEEMDIGDAIVYQRCVNIFLGFRNIEASYAALDELSSRGHFLAKIASWLLKILYRRHTSLSALHALVDIHRSPYYAHRIGPALASIKVIYSSIRGSHTLPTVEKKICCPIHSSGGEEFVAIERLQAGLCIFCELACMLNMF
ncbi:hypothetical protein DCAR_0729360 [Daucus carota subsp. sativus]|uniref:Uncharacterized protein n=1 Tax=Daucus carota subsp. sativus TaxID=79200 RepID=A0A161Y7W0_DAUCS|nr:hypothetical protein DCAR_0729360 [Daucus carota subsp. sativus]